MLASNLAVALVFLLVGATVVLAVTSAERARRDQRASRQANLAAADVKDSALDLETGARGFGLTGQEPLLQPYREARARLPKQLATLARESRNDPAQARRAGQLEDGVSSLDRRTLTPFIDAVRFNRLSKRQAIRFTKQGKRRADALRRLSQQYQRASLGSLVDSEERAQGRANLAVIAVIAGVLVGVIVVILQQLALRRRVLDPLEELSDAAGRVQAGDLEARTGMTPGDEVGRVGRDFDTMADELQASVSDLQRSNAELEQFAYIASHDLGEPLRVMAGFAGLLDRQYGGQLDERADRYIQGINDGSERMRELIDDLLAYSRVGSQDLKLEPVDAAALFDEVVTDLGEAIRESGAEVRANGLPTVTADAGSLRVVFQNLIANALKFRGDDPPVVDVSAERGASSWRFEVADNGIGIDPGHAERIFRMFQRLHTREEYPGTGIGLPIVQRSLERMGGTIAVRQREEGGTVFEFSLPRG